MKYLRTNEIVVPQVPYQGQQLRSIVREGVVPSLVIARDMAGAKRPDVRSYTGALRRQGARILEASGYVIGQEVSLDDLVEVVTVPSADLRHVVRDINQDPTVHSIMVMSPTVENYDSIVAELSPRKDVDGMNPDSGRTPCTPQAIQGALDFRGLWRPDLNYTLVGKGRTVNSYVAQALQKLHHDAREAQELEEMDEDPYQGRLRIVTRSNQEELPDAMAASDVVIVAAGVKRQIRPAMIHPGMKAVVGVCIEDIHPNAYALRSDTFITPRHLDVVNMGIGSLTASIALQNTLDAAMAQVPAW